MEPVRRVADELFERLRYFALAPQVIVDLGAGTGAGALRLRRLHPRARVLAIDLSERSLQAIPASQRHWRRLWQRAGVDRICADAAALPLRSESIDLLYSNLMLPWCHPPDAVLREIARVLRPGGLLLFSTLGPDTLRELRQAWAAVDREQHVPPLVEMHELGDALMHAGLARPVTDVEHFRLHFEDVAALMRELKRVGGGDALRTRARGLTARSRWRQMRRHYEALRTPQGLPATFEVIFGAAFGAEERPAHGEDEVVIPLNAIRRRKTQPR